MLSHSSRHSLGILPIAVLLLCISLQTNAEVPEQEISSELIDNSRPKIGLVLSGGGARGFAHIGVLKVLEQNNIPIDYIVGTSMGSIVGALYAIGLTPEEIELGVNNILWEKVFNDFAFREYRYFRRKSDDFSFFNIHRVGITSDGLQLSPGLIEGQQIELALDRLGYPGFHIDDYDNFRIPFRAIATDIETGYPVIIKSGNIARAMRASMSIPGALPPIKIDGKLLVDGGIANNVPIDIAREMGADIVIVIDISAPLASQKEIKSTLDITGQLTTIMTRRIANKQLETLTEDDVLIVPGEKEIGSSDFLKYPELIEEGERSANENLDKLKKLSLSQEDYSEHIASLPVIARKAPVIDFIEIDNKTALRDEVFKIRINQKLGEPLDIPQLEQDLSYIYGLDFSSSVVYSLEERDGKTGLIVYVRDRSWANSYLQFGLSIKSESDLGSLTNFDVAYTKHDLNSLAGEFRATAGLGSEPQLNAEIYQPMTVNLDYFISTKIGLSSTLFPSVIDNTIENMKLFRRRYIDLSIGKLFKQTTELRLGYYRSNGETRTISGTDSAFELGDFEEGYIFARLMHDSLDNLSFPNTGMFSGITTLSSREDLGADSDFDQLKLILSGAGTVDRYSIFTRLMLETTIDEDAPYNALFRRGGFLEISGTMDRELAGQHFGLIQAAFYRRLGDITFLPIYSGFSIEGGNAWNSYDDISSDTIKVGGSIFIGADTFVGPIYFAFGATDQGDKALYFNLGQTFLEP